MILGNFTGQNLTKLLMLVVVVVLLFCYLGILMLCAMEWLTRAKYATEASGKHGISSENASRLGGALLAIAFGLAVLNGLLFTDVVVSSTDIRFASAIIVLTSFVGLLEDINNGMLSPRLRLLLLSVIFVFAFLYDPFLMPGYSTHSYLGLLVSIPLLGALLCAAFTIGFINAVNMADGANGLMPGIALISFFCFSVLSGSMSWVWSILTYVVATFTLFNVVSGRLFLGDCGSYAIGVLAVLGSFSGINNGILSVGFLAALFSYPCIEMVLSLYRRNKAGRSPFLPDNDHFHNRLNHFLKSRFSTALLANSGTGLAISCATSGTVVSLLMLDILPMDHAGWWYVFVGLAGLHIALFTLLGNSAPRSVQFVAASTSHEDPARV